jgi:peptide/nickel transport system ATP-binding protein
MPERFNAPNEQPAGATPPLLCVQDLRVTLGLRRGAVMSSMPQDSAVEVLRGVSFDLHRGQTLGLIGESGSGKSMTALALMGLLPEGARTQGSIKLQGESLVGASDQALRGLRGNRIAMVFQEPMTALNPVHRIGAQIAEPLKLHRGMDAAAARAQALRLLERVRMPQAAERLDAYPHQLSGGQRQRVMIAMALACEPEVLLADEPTTALDASLQREVLTLISELVRESGMALLLISHDLGVMAHSVQTLAVMYAGRIVEMGPTREVFERRLHPYTQGLHAARPLPGMARGTRLATIPGRVPDLRQSDAGCAFAPRCERKSHACSVDVPSLRGVTHPRGLHQVACVHPRVDATAPATATSGTEVS